MGFGTLDPKIKSCVIYQLSQLGTPRLHLFLTDHLSTDILIMQWEPYVMMLLAIRLTPDSVLPLSVYYVFVNMMFKFHSILNIEIRSYLY